MVYKKLIAPLAGLALAISAVASVPAVAQTVYDDDSDDTLLWMLAGTAAVTALILVIALNDEDEEEVPQPVSP